MNWYMHSLGAIACRSISYLENHCSGVFWKQVTLKYLSSVTNLTFTSKLKCQSAFQYLPILGLLCSTYGTLKTTCCAWLRTVIQAYYLAHVTFSLWPALSQVWPAHWLIYQNQTHKRTVLSWCPGTPSNWNNWSIPLSVFPFSKAFDQASCWGDQCHGMSSFPVCDPV